MKYVFATIVLALGTVPVGTDIFNSVRSSLTFVDSSQFVGCVYSINIPPKLNTTLIAADVIVLVLTWVKSFAHWREMQRLNLTSSITAVLLRDGMSILQLLTYSSGPAEGGTYATSFVKYMPPLLIQRFILNLRQLNSTAQASENNSDAQHFSRFSVSFRVPSDFLGNIGEPLDRGPSEPLGAEEDGDPGQYSEARETQDGLDGGLAHQASPSNTRREEQTEAGIVSVPRYTGRESEEDDIGSSAPPRAMMIGPSTVAD
ncbi:uncharacterized protein PHACADRAFT_203457 [Phanerochaete carnosa HHB-10118-sp]|uniref:Uncharacterized protein n=1 Tax=Phanerochaete carnosa (strain HHB-10118-sp) TaxID=650164 RepID=K5WLY4_PHACS|nr:uncharacterized protein PHACADRAFT_203457 [Phanerochaete carnosa HHB-10118-sp]EKM60199.1 hypothetical protein PHACADRAFT_203457 [Phanerochaete carnosa HHB-10118-sp]